MNHITALTTIVDPVSLVAGVFTAVAACAIFLIVTIIRRETKPAEPQPTGETYEPKHEGDLPGWDK